MKTKSKGANNFNLFKVNSDVELLAINVKFLKRKFAKNVPVFIPEGTTKSSDCPE